MAESIFLMATSIDKATITAHPSSLNKKRPRHMTMEIQVLT